ncbi:MAG: HEAT repeat domain-containing protein [Planctomycetes bacterium]|nr:HEAT repeat domain-containing protein [Planctomycetota bacterium]
MRRVRCAVLSMFVVAACSNGPTANTKSLDAYERYLGALELAEGGDPIDARDLLGLLADPDPLARDGAVVALGLLGDSQHTSAVINMLYERVEADGQVRNTPLVRADACRTLARLRDERAVPALLNVLKGDTDEGVRRTAALALESFADRPGVVEALVDAMGDSGVSVAHDAHGVLARVSGRDDLPRDPAAWREWLKSRTP